MNYQSFRTCFSSTDWLFEYIQRKNFIKREFMLYCKISNFNQSRTVPHMLHEIVYIACPTQYMVSKYEIRTKYVKTSGFCHFIPRCTLKNILASEYKIISYFLKNEEARMISIIQVAAHQQFIVLVNIKTDIIFQIEYSFKPFEPNYKKKNPCTSSKLSTAKGKQ